MSQSDKKEIAKARFITGETIAAIADAIGVTRRTIERWADEGDWRSLRLAATEQAPNVVTLKPRSAESREPSTHPPIRRRAARGDLDKVEITEDAIAQLSTTLSGDIDPKSIGSIATALIRLMEYHDKKQPETAIEVARMALGLGLSPTELARQMREQCQNEA